ncbi:MAG TPA: NADH-quinone oxidoreductase subunit NuoG, partial [Sphingobacteriaceae bacterium]
MAIIYIDKKPYEVTAGKNLLEVCLSLGFDLPYFCWHPAMGSVGACRQCAVKVFKDAEDTRGRLMMSCMEMVRDNLFVSIDDPFAKAFRSQVIEWLMTNHPHDCAVCDEGGSCHLQDMTVMTGHNYRRFDYKKRTYLNQYLGPFLNHEMNRCIQCYRCVRFYKDYAGGKDLNVFAAHDHVYFGREKDGVLESEFSGNLAEVCPTGVFTDKTLKEHYTRKWDLTMAPSICQHCSAGCNIIGGERYGELRQITSRYNDEVNGYFICDRGRFGYEFVNDTINRIRHPLIRGHVPEAVDGVTLRLEVLGALNKSRRILGIGSPRASLESNFALRQLVGKSNFYQGVSETEAQLLHTILKVYNSESIHIPSLKEAEGSDCVLILGEDPTNSAPRLALAVRQTIRNKSRDDAQKLHIAEWHDAAQRELAQEQKGEIFIAYPAETKLDEIASGTFHLAPDNIARLGYAIAHFLNPAVPLPENLDDHIREIAVTIAGSLKKAKKPLIVSGTSLFNEAIIKAAYDVASALKNDVKADLCYIVPECNSLGLAMMEAPSLNEVHGRFQPGITTLIVVENDLYRHGSKDMVDELFDKCDKVIVLDHLHNPTTNRADILIPAGTFAEADGTLVNYEGRAQRFFQVFAPGNDLIRESWRWIGGLHASHEGQSSTDRSSQDIMQQLVREMPQFKGAETVSPPNDFRIAGQKIPREPHRYSGRTAMLANINVSEPKPPEDTDSPLSYTMEGFRGIPPAPLVPFFWAPGWNSVQSINKYQIEVGGPLHGGDPGRRLLPRSSALNVGFLNSVPKKFEPIAGEWQIIPLNHIFGSEELSVYSKGVLERSPEPYVVINHADAAKLKVAEGEKLNLQIGPQAFDLPVSIRKDLPPGCAGIPVNISPLVGIAW